MATYKGTWMLVECVGPFEIRRNESIIGRYKYRLFDPAGTGIAGFRGTLSEVRDQARACLPPDHANGKAANGHARKAKA